MDMYPYTLCDNCLISNPASAGKLPGTKNQEVYVSTARLDQVVNESIYNCFVNCALFSCYCLSNKTVNALIPTRQCQESVSRHYKEN